VARAIDEHEWNRTDVLSELAQVLTQVGKFEQALEMVEAIEHENVKMFTLGEIARTLSVRRRFDQAIAIVEMVEDGEDETQEDILVDVVALARDNLEQLLEAVQAHKDKYLQVSALCIVAQIL